MKFAEKYRVNNIEHLKDKRLIPIVGTADGETLYGDFIEPSSNLEEIVRDSPQDVGMSVATSSGGQLQSASVSPVRSNLIKSDLGDSPSNKPNWYRMAGAGAYGKTLAVYFK